MALMEQLRYISYKNWESNLNPMLKAFDSIDHNCLRTKLRLLCLMQSVVSWFSSYLLIRKQRVRFEVSISGILSIKHGVLQGLILGSIVFTIYMDDLVNKI